MTRPFEVREALRGAAAYNAPQADAPVRLNTNESPWRPPERFTEDLAVALRSMDLNRYPDRDARALRTGLAGRHGWEADGIWAANGSNEVLQTLLLTFGGPGRAMLIFEPTYAMYPHLAMITGTELIAKELPEPWTLDAETVGWGVSFDPPAITMLCSPNNPTGTSYPLSAVRAALEAGPGIVVVDEAYGEFGGESATALLPEHDRLVVVRSFSKSWRMAGARIGYALGHPWLIEALQLVRLPYHLSALTQTAGEVALKHQQAMLGAVAEIVAERDRLYKELERVPGVEAFRSDANFILFRTARDAGTLWRTLADRGVLVRDFSSKIPRALRVTVGTAEQNLTFVETLRSVLVDG